LCREQKYCADECCGKAYQYMYLTKLNKSKVTVLIVFKDSYRSEILSFAFSRNPAVFQAIITVDS